MAKINVKDNDYFDESFKVINDNIKFGIWIDVILGVLILLSI